MAEIILSFFAVIGICALFLRFFEVLSFRDIDIRSTLPLIIDLRGKEKEEIFDLFERLYSVCHRPSGKIIQNSICIFREKEPLSRGELMELCLLFHFKAHILDENEFEQWKREL